MLGAWRLKMKRPSDVNQRAKLVVDIATDEESDPEETPLIKRARTAGRKGGKARSCALTPDERSKIARAAASARWKKNV